MNLEKHEAMELLGIICQKQTENLKNDVFSMMKWEKNIGKNMCA